MSAIKAFIVDDEFQGRNLLDKMLHQYFPDIDIVGQASTCEEGINGIDKYAPNVVFLDIQMKGETGFDLLNRLPAINFSLIFTTAFDNYAIKAFRFNAIDYLLKPIVANELIEAVNKVWQRSVCPPVATKKHLEQLQWDLNRPDKIYEQIAIPTNEGFMFVPVNDIVYCQADSNYTKFYLNGNKFIVSSYTLRQYDELLSRQSFFRTHRSYLINLAHIKIYRRGDGGVIIMSNGHEVELAKTHKEEFLSLVNVKH